MFVFVSFFVATAIASPVPEASVPRGDLYCASLLADPGARTPAEIEALRRAIIVPFGKFSDLRDKVHGRDAWPSRLRVSLERLRPVAVPRLHLERSSNVEIPLDVARAMDVGRERLKFAHNDLLEGSLGTYPVRKLAVGADEVRAYLRDARARADELQRAFDAGVPSASPSKEPWRVGRKLGSTVGALMWAGVGCAVGGLTFGMVSMHWYKLAVGVPAVGLFLLYDKIVPRIYRLYLNVHGAYAGVAGRRGPVGAHDFAVEQLRLLDEIERRLDDPTSSPETLIYSASTIELPLSTDDEAADAPAKRRSPSSDELVRAVSARGSRPAPVDARRFESDLVFFYDAEMRPTLVSLLREPPYVQDAR